ncbi:MAG: AmmeMemoRadiSam system protein A [Candidatus Aminicenantes bacterium]|nr:AmmeMemoRadiSam system protein A [Candidatus Aminicenantes bacterium]
MAELSRQEEKELLSLARHTINKHLASGKGEYPPVSNPVFKEKRGVFVTLHRQGDLRGCIGYPLPYKPLWEAVVDNAIAASSEDPRFPAVTAAELPGLHIEISVLTVPQPVASHESVKVGRDGIIISKGFQRGLLLPQVPLEQGWDLEQYISYGCLKAGLARDEWKRGVKIETFQAQVFGEKEPAEKP